MVNDEKHNICNQEGFYKNVELYQRLEEVFQKLSFIRGRGSACYIQQSKDNEFYIMTFNNLGSDDEGNLVSMVTVLDGQLTENQDVKESKELSKTLVKVKNTDFGYLANFERIYAFNEDAFKETNQLLDIVFSDINCRFLDKPYNIK